MTELDCQAPPRDFTACGGGRTPRRPSRLAKHRPACYNQTDICGEGTAVDEREYIDLYDEERRPLGKTVLRGTELEAGEYLKVVHVCLFDPQGRMLIQQRQSCKREYPDLWDLTAGGGVQTGEDGPTAIRRELREELGLDLDFTTLRPYLTVNFDDGFDDIYLLTLENPPEVSSLRFQPTEVRDARWVDRETAEAMLEEGTFAPFYREFLGLLFAMAGNPMGFLRP